MRYIIINMTDYSLEKDLDDIIINPDTDDLLNMKNYQNIINYKVIYIFDIGFFFSFFNYLQAFRFKFNF